MNNKFSLVIVFVLFFGSICGNAANNNESPLIKAKSIAENLINLNTPLHIVLAIDSSASMNASADAKTAAIEFLKIVKNRINNSIKVGYVSWKHYPASYSKDLSSNYHELYDNISNIDFTGNTCLMVGLNKSLDLLNEAKSTEGKDIIVIISDGEENCNTSRNFTCEDLSSINLQGVQIYTIQTGNLEKKNPLLECLKNADFPTPLRNVVTEWSNTTDDPFYVRAQGRNIAIRELSTNMTITKRIIKGNLGPRILLRISAPNITEVKSGMVIALDSSGSLGTGGRPEYGRYIREVMPKILDKIEEKMPNNRISIVSWDNDIDFTYRPLTKDKNATPELVPISLAKKEIAEDEVFMKKSPYDKLFGLINISRWIDDISPLSLFVSKKDYPENYYYFDEYEGTNLSLALERPIRTLDKAYSFFSQNRTDASRKVILLMTGRSEFSPCDPRLINDAQRKNYGIFAIGLGVIDGSKMHKELINMTANQKNETRYYYSPGSVDWTGQVADKEIDKIIYEIATSEIANNFTLVDTIYPYLRVNPNSITTTENGQKINISSSNITNSDGTTTLKLGFNRSIKPEDIIEISIDTEFNLSLPVDVTESRTSKAFVINNQTMPSSLSYIWQSNGKKYTLPLPENSISIY